MDIKGVVDGTCPRESDRHRSHKTDRARLQSARGIAGSADADNGDLLSDSSTAEDGEKDAEPEPRSFHGDEGWWRGRLTMRRLICQGKL